MWPAWELGGALFTNAKKLAAQNSTSWRKLSLIALGCTLALVLLQRCDSEDPGTLSALGNPPSAIVLAKGQRVELRAWLHKYYFANIGDSDWQQIRFRWSADTNRQGSPPMLPNANVISVHDGDRVVSGAAQLFNSLDIEGLGIGSTSLHLDLLPEGSTSEVEHRVTNLKVLVTERVRTQVGASGQRVELIGPQDIIEDAHAFYTVQAVPGSTAREYAGFVGARRSTAISSNLADTGSAPHHSCYEEGRLKEDRDFCVPLPDEKYSFKRQANGGLGFLYSVITANRGSLPLPHQLTLIGVRNTESDVSVEHLEVALMPNAAGTGTRINIKLHDFFYGGTDLAPGFFTASNLSSALTPLALSHNFANEDDTNFLPKVELIWNCPAASNAFLRNIAPGCVDTPAQLITASYINQPITHYCVERCVSDTAQSSTAPCADTNHSSWQKRVADCASTKPQVVAAGADAPDDVLYMQNGRFGYNDTQDFEPRKYYAYRLRLVNRIGSTQAAPTPTWVDTSLTKIVRRERHRAPTRVNVEYAGSRELRVSWSHATSGTEFELEECRKSAAGRPTNNELQAATTAAWCSGGHLVRAVDFSDCKNSPTNTATSCVRTGLQTDKHYYYRVRAAASSTKTASSWAHDLNPRATPRTTPADSVGVVRTSVAGELRISWVIPKGARAFALEQCIKSTRSVPSNADLSQSARANWCTGGTASVVNLADPDSCKETTTVESTSCTITNLLATKYYYYRVRTKRNTHHAAGEWKHDSTPADTPASATTQAKPTSVQVQRTSVVGELKISWRGTTGARFDLEKCIKSSAGKPTTAQLAQSARADWCEGGTASVVNLGNSEHCKETTTSLSKLCTVEDLDTTKHYYFRVRAKAVASSRLASAWAHDSTPQTTPRAVAIAAAAISSVQVVRTTVARELRVSWASAGSPEFVLEECKKSARAVPSSTDLAQGVSSNWCTGGAASAINLDTASSCKETTTDSSTTCTRTGLDTSKYYYYRVRTRATVSALQSLWAQDTTPIDSPLPQNSLSVEHASAGELFLSWVSAESSVQIQQCVSTSATRPAGLQSARSTWCGAGTDKNVNCREDNYAAIKSCTVRNLQTAPDKHYHYRIKFGTGQWVQAAAGRFVTQPRSGTGNSYAAPTNVMVAYTGVPGELRLSWQSTAQGFDIEECSYDPTGPPAVESFFLDNLQSAQSTGSPSVAWCAAQGITTTVRSIDLTDPDACEETTTATSTRCTISSLNQGRFYVYRLRAKASTNVNPSAWTTDKTAQKYTGDVYPKAIAPDFVTQPSIGAGTVGILRQKIMLHFKYNNPRFFNLFQMQQCQKPQPRTRETPNEARLQQADKDNWCEDGVASVVDVGSGASGSVCLLSDTTNLRVCTIANLDEQPVYWYRVRVKTTQGTDTWTPWVADKTGTGTQPNPPYRTPSVTSSNFRVKKTSATVRKLTWTNTDSAAHFELEECVKTSASAPVRLDVQQVSHALWCRGGTVNAINLGASSSCSETTTTQSKACTRTDRSSSKHYYYRVRTKASSSKNKSHWVAGV